MDWETNESLIGTLKRDGEERAWELFFDQYAPALQLYCCKLGLGETDAQEVVQETMIEMMRILPGFEYDPRRRFRNFILTVAHRKALHFLRSERRRRAVLEKYAHHADEDLAACGETGFDEKQWRLALFETAWRDYRRHSTADTRVLDAFEAVALRGECATAVAERLNLSANAVYQLKSRLTRTLRVQVFRMEASLS